MGCIPTTYCVSFLCLISSYGRPNGSNICQHCQQKLIPSTH
uniref:Uncharacterized protein n=1 Tax=Anguilla anguilla TaxID=7936 RepID=A0A0E9VDK8_ANGAN